MLYALLQELYSMNPEATFAVLSPISLIIPPNVEGKVEYVKPSLLIASKEILKSSILVIGGGTHLFDYGNKIKALKILFRLFLLILYSKLLGKKVWLLGMGLGPLQTTYGKFLARAICYMADYISVRDKSSYKFLMEWELPDKASLAFDLSVLIKPFSEIEHPSIKQRKKILGISITPVFELYYGSKEKDLALITEISRHLNKWLKKESQAEVRLFIFHGGLRDSDTSITQLLQEKLQPPECIKFIPYNPDPRKMLAQVGQCDAFVGMKYHSIVFAYINGIPLLVIEYHPKCRSFAEEIRLPRHVVVSPEGILNGHFEKRFKNLTAHPENFIIATLPLDEAKQRAKKCLPKGEEKRKS